MPTVILLDASLSMLRPVENGLSSNKNGTNRNKSNNGNIEGAAFGENESALNTNSSGIELMNLAKWGIDKLLTHFEQSYKLEQIAVLTFSSQCDLVVPFTRDIPEVRAKVTLVDGNDTTNISAGFGGVVTYVKEQWGDSVPINCVLVTDGGQFCDDTYEESLLSNLDSIFPFSFGGSLSVLCINHIDNHAFVKRFKSVNENLIQRSGLEGDVFMIRENSDLNRTSVEDMFQRLIDLRYHPYCGTLSFGRELSSTVTLCPPPAPFKEVRDFETIEAKVSNQLVIKGMLSMSDVASPPVVSRHLILAHDSKTSNSMDSQDNDILARQPSLCVFLHGAMKAEGLCALVQVAEAQNAGNSSANWFGIIFSYADTKKKSTLMLALLEPGDTPVPWMDNLRSLGPMDELTNTSETTNHFPVKASSHRPSYSSSPVVWIKHASLHSDIQKILRHARKLPEKSLHFYKELNRLKRAALYIGFYELLEGCAAIFDRECALLSSGSQGGIPHPDCAIQLRHAASELRSRAVLNVDYQITPLQN